MPILNEAGDRNVQISKIGYPLRAESSLGKRRTLNMRHPATTVQYVRPIVGTKLAVTEELATTPGSLSPGLTEQPVLIIWRMYAFLIKYLRYMPPGRSLTAVWTIAGDGINQIQPHIPQTSSPKRSSSLLSHDAFNWRFYHPRHFNYIQPRFGLEIAVNGISGYPQAKMMSRYLQNTYTYVGANPVTFAS